jgi:hypothetical protein
MGETYHFLKDEDELRWFYSYCVPPLKPNECYFASNSARNKVFTEAEKQTFMCGRSEMWLKTVITEDSYLSVRKGIRRLECNKEAYLTKSGLSYPAKCLVLYWNIVPTDAYKAMKDQLINLVRIQQEMTDSIIKGSKEALESSWKNVRHSHTTGQSVFARSFGTAEWVDIDMDCLDWKRTTAGWECLDAIKMKLTEILGRANYVQIQTAGGWHWLLRVRALKEAGRALKEDPIKRIITEMGSELESYNFHPKEIVRNSNEMIPLPGTLQYGSHVVQVYNKEDFTEADRLHDYPVKLGPTGPALIFLHDC